MRAFRWIIITGAVVIVLALAAIAIGAVWLNTYIHSDAFKVEVQARAAQSLGGTVQIDKIDFDIFNGVKLQGLVAQIDPSHDGGQGALQVQVASVNCTYAWKELLNRELKLTGVTLDKPQIVLTKQETPAAPPQPATGFADSGGAGGQGTALPFQFILDKAKINDGSVSVRDATGASMVDLQGVDVDANTSGFTSGQNVTGTLKIADMALPSNMHVANFSTPFTYGGGGVQAAPFAATSFGGNLAGDYQAPTSGLSIFDLNAKGIDVAQLTAATISNSSAKLTGSLDLQSKWRGIETGDLNGEGDTQLTNGTLQGVKILTELSQLLKIKELNDPIISKASTHFLIQNRQTRFTGLQLTSSIFQMTGDGTVGFDGTLNANLVLILTPGAMAKLPKEAAASFVAQQDGSGSIAFHVTGTTANPQTDLATRLLLQNTQIKNVINKALDKFFH